MEIPIFIFRGQIDTHVVQFGMECAYQSPMFAVGHRKTTEILDRFGDRKASRMHSDLLTEVWYRSVVEKCGTEVCVTFYVQQRLKCRDLNIVCP